jgi:hypothetical protein
MVYFTSIISAVQTFTCIRPLSSLKTTLPGFTVCDIIAALVWAARKRKNASMAAMPTLRIKGRFIFNMGI